MSKRKLISLLLLAASAGTFCGGVLLGREARNEQPMASRAPLTAIPAAKLTPIVRLPHPVPLPTIPPPERASSQVAVTSSQAVTTITHSVPRPSQPTTPSGQPDTGSRTQSTEGRP